MALDEAKVEYALGRVEILDKKIELLLDSIESERAERVRLSESRENRMISEFIAKLGDGINELRGQLEKNIELKFQACLSEQSHDIDCAVIDIGDLKQNVAELDIRTREVPLLRGRVEHLETQPGQRAIGTLGRIFIAVGAIASAFLGAFFSWVFTRGSTH